MKKIAILLMMIIGFSICCQKKENIQKEPEKPYTFDGGNTAIGTPEWKVENAIAISDTNHVLMMTVKEKYDGYHELYAMAFFSNEKTRQYKAVAPWYEDVKFGWENVTSKTAIKVLYDSIPKDRVDIWNVIERLRAERK